MGVQMTRKIFIPQKCRVGFQERKDTFTNKLAYVIYYDSLGKLRKETSWEGWRSKTIDPWDFENVPTTGFMLNKGIQRYNWTHFGTGRSMIRIYDPRGIEFEITPDNLIGILMHTDCCRREIQGELVYAWCGTKLMLLPCCSEEYKAAANYTALQTKKVSARELKEGLTYVTKREQHIVYLGRRMWYQQPRSGNCDKHRTGSKEHIFCDLGGKNFQIVNNVTGTIAAIADEHCHPQFSQWVDDYHKTEMSASVVNWIKKPITLDQFKTYDWKKNHRNHMIAFIDGPNETFIRVSICLNRRCEFYQTPQQDDINHLSYLSCSKIYRDGTTHYEDSWYSYGYTRKEAPVTVNSIETGVFFDLCVEFSNGIIRKWE